jgi:hypothetical protein
LALHSIPSFIVAALIDTFALHPSHGWNSQNDSADQLIKIQRSNVRVSERYARSSGLIKQWGALIEVSTYLLEQVQHVDAVFQLFGRMRVPSIPRRFAYLIIQCLALSKACHQ